MYEEWLEGAYDLHVHTGPDVTERVLDDFEMAERAQALNMKGFCIKSHYFCTAARARLVKKLYPKLSPIGAITLNYSSGGMNPYAVEMAARDGAKMVWMPTVDTKNEMEYLLKNHSYETLPASAKVRFDLQQQGKIPTGLSILENGKLTKDVCDVLEIISERELILATGHLSKIEIIALIRAAHELKLRKVVVTHPTFPSVNLTKEEQKELAQLGAYMDQCYAVITPALGVDWNGMYEMIRYVGPEHCILTSDLGMGNNIFPDEGMVRFVTNLANHGFTKEEIRSMTAGNTSFLVEG
jgi:hypothetical protein